MLEQIPTKADLIAAHQRILPYVHQTPVFTSSWFDAEAGKNCFFKSEHLQKTGAFKARGAMNAVLVNAEEGKLKGFLTHSSGNHGAALAWAAAQIGAKAYIVMPDNAPKTKIAAVQQYGGIITFCEATLVARETTAAQVQEATGAVFIHPYDNYDIIAGQATATMELLDVRPDLELLFIPVGGGGLLSGAALANHYFGKAKVIGCEPLNASDAYQSFQAGVRIPVQNPDTIADGLRTSLGERNFNIIQQYVHEIITATEDEMKAAWKFTVSRLKQLVEPSAAAGLAVALKHGDQRCGILLCGGNMDLDPFA